MSLFMMWTHANETKLPSQVRLALLQGLLNAAFLPTLWRRGSAAFPVDKNPRSNVNPVSLRGNHVSSNLDIEQAIRPFLDSSA